MGKEREYDGQSVAELLEKVVEDQGIVTESDKVRFTMSQCEFAIACAENLVPPSRPRSLALTKLEEAQMWLFKCLPEDDCLTEDDSEPEVEEDALL